MEGKNGDQAYVQPCFQEVWLSIAKRLCRKLSGGWAGRVKKHPLKDER